MSAQAQGVLLLVTWLESLYLFITLPRETLILIILVIGDCFVHITSLKFTQPISHHITKL